MTEEERQLYKEVVREKLEEDERKQKEYQQRFRKAMEDSKCFHCGYCITSSGGEHSPATMGCYYFKKGNTLCNISPPKTECENFKDRTKHIGRIAQNAAI